MAMAMSDYHDAAYGGPYHSVKEHPQGCEWCSSPYGLYPKCQCSSYCGWQNCIWSQEMVDKPLVSSKPESDSLYCSQCTHWHFGHGLGICHKGACKCPLETSKAKDAYAFSSEVVEAPITIMDTSTSIMSPESIVKILKGYKGWNHEWATPNADEMAWLESNIEGIVTKTTPLYDFWNGFVRHTWCGRGSWETAANLLHHSTMEAFYKWDYTERYIQGFYDALSEAFQNKPSSTSMPTAIIVGGSVSRPRTQKANGLKGINRFNEAMRRSFRHQFQSKPHYLCKIERVLEEDNVVALSGQLLSAWKVITSIGFGKLFARPCPKTPRHGFVDSRVLELTATRDNWQDLYSTYRILLGKSDAEARAFKEASPGSFELLEAFVAPLKALALEIREHDKRGEIVLMPFVEATKSAIYANGAVTIGLGNEGATSGDNAIVFPCADVWPEDFDADWWAKFGIKNSPFLEVVYEALQYIAVRGQNGQSTIDPIKANAILVQLRDGPKMDLSSGGGDYIPEAIEINCKLVLDVASRQFSREKNALIAFEKAVASAPKGTIVIHRGGAISSHYGIHCVMNKVPYICSRELCGWFDAWDKAITYFGSTATFTLQPTTTVNGHRGEPDKASWHKGFNAGLWLEALPYADSMIQTSLYFLHSSSAIDFNAGHVSYAFGFALAQTLKLGMIALVGEARHRKVDLDGRKANTLEAGQLDRETVYKTIDQIAPELLARHSLEIAKAFSFEGWGSRIGGHNWHLCAIEVARTWNAVIDYLDGGSFMPVLAGLNNVIHASHNGAKMLTKFSTIETMDMAAKCPPVMALITAPILWYLVNTPHDNARAIKLYRGPSAKEVEDAVITEATRRSFASITMESL